MNTRQLFRHSRIRLAFWYASVMAFILSLLSIGVYRSLVESKWWAIKQEMESIAGTLHDSLEPMLPTSGNPTQVLKTIFPELCLVNQPCSNNSSLIQRHTIGISDRTTYYLRLFDHHQNLLAFSPHQPSQLSSRLESDSWQIVNLPNGTRYLQFSIMLHSGNSHNQPNHSHPPASWGYLQIGRNLRVFDGEIKQIQLILLMGFPIALTLVAISSWGLSGLAMQPIYESYQQQQQFTANVSHELKTPLTSLLATVEAVNRLENSQENTQTLLNTIERQGRRLSNLITDLLLLTSLEQNSSQKQFQPCCLNDLINDLTEEFLELAVSKNIDLTSDVCDREIYTLGNESELYRLVANLIANALQYTPKSGKVNISLNNNQKKAIIKVQDTGIGISNDQQTRIFERFYRVDSDRNRKTGGTGLGLAIASAIAKKHQASLTVESFVGKGSIFILKINLIN
ncbi:two-component system sensor histidine kinase RppB [Cyanobacterium sp. Dongsha4]|uniref:two-component system sensor histidine kinase RppB n=1 Tax=Cyanobacterium sp. DS4 TaxID=2878255 RepID=UPI002E8039E3|nr:two-component system sensor histidine kinase RppB [Cyanobacterium sp. Dongsha4]WVL00050.1 ATP-binding protein [Cyanobacterium sp. Dongsha4]